ncbi:CBS domain-containing protein [Aquabacterium sp.]|uniref:CBS domain-containing protein n=1 Tax=Aquabacterium sp. TaxID=1872578 RepID=UPI0035AEA050
MPDSYRFMPLPLVGLTHAPQLPSVQRTARPHDPAVTLFTDLHHSACVVAGHHDGLDQTLHLMMRAGVRMVFVSGADGSLIGMVSAEDIQGERPVLHAATRRVSHHELTIADVMVPLSQWPTVDMSVVRTSRLGDIAATLRDHGLRYLLVTQQKNGQTVLRGLFSARRLEMAMNITIEPGLHARTFAELEHDLAHH